MEIILKGIGNNEVEVNTDDELQVTTNQDYEKAGFTNINGVNSSAGNLLNEIPAEASEDFRVRIGIDNPIFMHTPQGPNFNSNIFKQINSAGMSISVEDDAYVMNSTETASTGEYCSIQTWKQFQLNKSFGLYGEVDVLLVNALANGYQLDIGFFNYTGIVDVVTGCGLTISSNSITAYVVYDYRGSTYTESILVNSSHNLIVNEYSKIGVLITSDVVMFYINNVLVASIVSTLGAPLSFKSNHLPFVVRLSHPSPDVLSSKVKIGSISIQFEDVNITNDWCMIASGNGNNTIQSSNGAGSGQTANNINSTVPITATLSNTVASYNTLGGKFIFSAPASSETDYALFAYQIPIGINMYIRNINIDVTLIGSAIDTTPTIMEWSLGANSSAESLATTESDDTKAPRRITLGNTSFKVGNIAGTNMMLTKTITSGLFVSSGCYVHVILRIPVCTVTASQTFRGQVSIEGYWE